MILGQNWKKWDWENMKKLQDAEVEDALKDKGEAQKKFDNATKLLNEKQGLTVPRSSLWASKCQLTREEEINLYYQCTQLTINNYALGHLGGERRAFPSWDKAFKQCNETFMHHVTDLSFKGNDGSVHICQPAKPTAPVKTD